jgi:hypothetical protein
VRKLILALVSSSLCCCGNAETAQKPADAGSDGGVCPASGVSKRPWVLHVDETSAIVRWEACSPSSQGDLHYAPEAGGADTVASSTVTEADVPETHTAAFMPSLPADLAGTYYMHDVALTNLAVGTCYTYSLAADSSMTGRFCTARASGATYKIMAVGDTNPGLGHTATLLANVANENYDLTLHEGDIQYYASGLETWASWFPLMAPMLAQGAFYAAEGNHELEQNDELAYYYDRFFGDAGFDGKDGYSRAESGGVWFFALNTEIPLDPGSPQETWFETQIKDASQKPGYRFSIVFYHKPFASCGDLGHNPGAFATFEPLFEQYGVELVLQGHLHAYERFEVPTAADPQKTVTYLTLGGGGGALNNPDYDLTRPECALRVESGAFFFLSILEIAPGKVSVRIIDEANTVRDSFDKTVP